MSDLVTVLLAAGMLVAAFGYATVGHGGASAYLAALALAGVAPPQMRPIALVLNIAVAVVATLGLRVARSPMAPDATRPSDYEADRDDVGVRPLPATPEQEPVRARG